MRKISMALLAFAGIFGMMSCTKTDNATAEDLTNYVEPRIGTAHCRYFHMAPGALPFGMAKPGPSTNGHYGNKSGREGVTLEGNTRGGCHFGRDIVVLE